MPIEMRGICPLIQVFELPTSVRFYRDMLDFEIVGDSPPRSPDRIAAHGDTCLFIGGPDVDGAYRYLRDKGLDLKEPRVTRYGMKQLYLKDRDGFGICFQSKSVILWRARDNTASDPVWLGSIRSSFVYALFSPNPS
jgi:catechol 2,3-dioxygenase-like lactoylglutathione lyase family enzyme